MISIECFKGLPLEYEFFLIERYNSFITTCRYIEIYNPGDSINYMLVYMDNTLIELLIFGNRGNTSTCFNSLVDIDQDILKECTKNIFIEYPTIQKIKILGSYRIYDLHRSFLISKSNDHILNLPLTLDNYYSELGSNTRKHIKNYKVRLLKDYPQVKFVTKYRVEIEDSIIDKIIELNIDRMKYKGIVPGKDKNDAKDFYKYSQHYGCVSYIEIDGNIVAGTISTILKKRIFLQVIAHDNNFSRYNIGQLCIFNLIQTSIEKKLSTFHFLWGENEYKERLLAKPKLLYSYLIYRDYSLDYILSNNKALFLSFLIGFRSSKYSKPLRNAVKIYRSKKWKL